MKKDTNEQNERIEPFATVLDLLADHGTEAVLESLACAAEYASADPELCPEVHEEASFLHVELSDLLERYELLFREPETATTSPRVIYYGKAVPV